jgi:high-affinity Fe2+/Pb2+ permease
MPEPDSKQDGNFLLPWDRVLGAIGFAILWTLGRAWWIGDYTIGKFFFVAGCVAVAGLVWVGLSERFRFLR